MSDDIEISYSFQVGKSEADPASAPAQVSAPATPSSLFAFARCEVLDLPDGNVLLVSRSGNRQLIVTRDVSIALNYCQEFRSLKDHARFLLAYMPELGGDEAGVEQVITSVKNAGMMTPAEDLCQRINQPSEVSKELAPSSVCIITCDRPAAVERLLESMLQGPGLSRHKQLFLVDDSRDATKAAANLAAVETFNLSSPKSMTYVGQVQQEELLQGLVSALPQHGDAARFLIDRTRWSQFKSYGLARTICLLLTVGQRCIIMDDDVICAALQSPHKADGIRFADNMRDADFYFDTQTWKEQTKPAQSDPLSGHLQCLGMNLASAIKTLGRDALEPEDLQNVDINLFTSLNADTPVLTTQSGSLGDPGTAGNNWLWSLRPDSVNRLLNARGGLASAFINRQNWLGRTTPTFSKRASMSQVTGMDNSSILPPFFPVFRGEDLIFGHMIDFLYPQSMALEYDWAVPHLPIEERKGNAQGDSTAVGGSLELLVNYFTDKRSEDSSVSFQTRLEALALVLQEVSERSLDGVLALFRSELARSQTATIRLLNDKIRRPDTQAEDWMAYLSHAMAENVEVLQTPSTPRSIPGMPEGMTDAAIIEQTKQFCADYARALLAWPALREAAREIVAQHSFHVS